MKIAKLGIISLALLTLVFSGCSSSSGGQSATPTPLKELTPTEFFDKISPSIAYIETPSSAGSGLLVDSGYIITCAHVVWPFEDVSVTFPNGDTSQAQVLNYDLMADIAVLEAVTTNISQLSLISQGNISTGAPVFAIGYPGENEEHLQPTLSQGMISTLRNWDTLNLSYIQTDAAVTFGESGGGLFSNKGELLGMTGYFYYGDNFALAISVADLLSRAERLVDGEDIAGLGSRLLPQTGGQRDVNITLENWFVDKVFVIREPKGTHIDIDATSSKDIQMWMVDANGGGIDYADDHHTGTESVSATIDTDGPLFLVIARFTGTGSATVKVKSTCCLFASEDADDGADAKIGETILASIDFPSDYDYYPIELLADEKINVAVDSLMINPYLDIAPSEPESLPDDILEEWLDEGWADDDSGGGLLSTNAELEFTAPEDGTYIIVVSDANDENIGGYSLTVE